MLTKDRKELHAMCAVKRQMERVSRPATILKEILQAVHVAILFGCSSGDER